MGDDPYTGDRLSDNISKSEPLDRKINDSCTGLLAKQITPEDQGKGEKIADGIQIWCDDLGKDLRTKSVNFRNKIKECCKEQAKETKNTKIKLDYLFKNGKYEDALVQLFKQKRTEGTKGTEKEKKQFTPAYAFSKKLRQYLKDEDIRAYLKSSINNCSVWIKPIDFRMNPVVYPHTVRGSFKKIKGVIDYRGFNLKPNPMSSIHTKKKISSGLYKNNKVQDGFEACHIWYDTTKAPPMFSYIPNMVYLPQTISKLSDKIRINDVMPPHLKDLAIFLYKKGKKINKNLIDIIEGCWKGLQKGKEGGPGPKDTRPRRTVNLIDLGDVKTDTSIKGILDFIKNCKAKKKEELLKDIETFEKKLERQETKKQKEKDEEEKAKTKGLEKEKQKRSKTQESQKGKNVKKPTSEQKILKPKDIYWNELKRMISKGESLSDLETWLTHYYKAITYVKDKKEFLDDIKNLPTQNGKPSEKGQSDFAKKYGQKKNVMNRKIRAVFEPQGIKNLTEAYKYLKNEDNRNKGTDEVLKDLEKENGEKQKDTPNETKKKTDGPKKVSDQFDLKDFVIDLCDRKGLSVELKNIFKQTSEKLDGYSFCFSGRMKFMKRKEAQKLVEKNGGEFKNDVKEDLTHLVTNSSKPTAKYKKAKEVGSKIISESDFISCIKTSPS